jgi:hypothetical protein
MLIDSFGFVQCICVREGRMKPANKEQFKHKVIELRGYTIAMSVLIKGVGWAACCVHVH